MSEQLYIVCYIVRRATLFVIIAPVHELLYQATVVLVTQYFIWFTYLPSYLLHLLF